MNAIQIQDEAMLGRLWKKLARAEGHSRGVPKCPRSSFNETQHGKRVVARRAEVDRLRDRGMSMRKIASKLDVSYELVRHDLQALRRQKAKL